MKVPVNRLRFKAIPSSTNGFSPALLTAAGIGTVSAEGGVLLLQMTAVEEHMALVSHPTKLLQLGHP